jgi:hypothetical protein
LEAKKLLLSAAKERAWYKNSKLAKAVAEFLVLRLNAGSLSQISYRTLQMGYELAEHNPKNWMVLLEDMISVVPDDPKVLVKQLAKEGLMVKDQASRFEQATGLKRRTFFKYRRELNVSRS